MATFTSGTTVFKGLTMSGIVIETQDTTIVTATTPDPVTLGELTGSTTSSATTTSIDSLEPMTALITIGSATTLTSTGTSLIVKNGIVTLMHCAAIVQNAPQVILTGKTTNTITNGTNVITGQDSKITGGIHALTGDYTLKLSGGIIEIAGADETESSHVFTGGTVTGHGVSICVISLDTTVTSSGGTVETTGPSSNEDGTTPVVEGPDNSGKTTTVSNSSATFLGASLVTITGGSSVTVGGQTTTSGGSVTTSTVGGQEVITTTNCTVTMAGGTTTIQGATLYVAKGTAICTGGSTITPTGGTVVGGTTTVSDIEDATVTGETIIISGGTVTINNTSCVVAGGTRAGGSIRSTNGGTTTTNGGVVNVTGESMSATVSGGVVTILGGNFSSTGTVTSGSDGPILAGDEMILSVGTGRTTPWNPYGPSVPSVPQGNDINVSFNGLSLIGVIYTGDDDPTATITLPVTSFSSEADVPAGGSLEVPLASSVDMGKVIGVGYVIDSDASYSSGKYINAEGVATVFVDVPGFKVVLHNDDTVTRHYRLVVMT